MKAKETRLPQRGPMIETMQIKRRTMAGREGHEPTTMQNTPIWAAFYEFTTF